MTVASTVASFLLEWMEGDVRHRSEPGAGVLRRLWIGFLSMLPIEWLL